MNPFDMSSDSLASEPPSSTLGLLDELASSESNDIDLFQSAASASASNVGAMGLFESHTLSSALPSTDDLVDLFGNAPSSLVGRISPLRSVPSASASLLSFPPNAFSPSTAVAGDAASRSDSRSHHAVAATPHGGSRPAMATAGGGQTIGVNKLPVLKRRASDSLLCNGGAIVLDQAARESDDRKFRDWLEHLDDDHQHPLGLLAVSPAARPIPIPALAQPPPPTAAASASMSPAALPPSGGGASSVEASAPTSTSSQYFDNLFQSTKLEQASQSQGQQHLGGDGGTGSCVSSSPQSGSVAVTSLSSQSDMAASYGATQSSTLGTKTRGLGWGYTNRLLQQRLPPAANAAHTQVGASSNSSSLLEQLKLFALNSGFASQGSSSSSPLAQATTHQPPATTSHDSPQAFLAALLQGHSRQQQNTSQGDTKAQLLHAAIQELQAIQATETQTTTQSQEWMSNMHTLRMRYLQHLYYNRREEFFPLVKRIVLENRHLNVNAVPQTTSAPLHSSAYPYDASPDAQRQALASRLLERIQQTTQNQQAAERMWQHSQQVATQLPGQVNGTQLVLQKLRELREEQQRCQTMKQQQDLARMVGIRATFDDYSRLGATRPQNQAARINQTSFTGNGGPGSNRQSGLVGDTNMNELSLHGNSSPSDTGDHSLSSMSALDANTILENSSLSIRRGTPVPGALAASTDSRSSSSLPPAVATLASPRGSNKRDRCGQLGDSSLPLPSSVFRSGAHVAKRARSSSTDRGSQSSTTPTPSNAHQSKSLFVSSQNFPANSGASLRNFEPSSNLSSPSNSGQFGTAIKIDASEAKGADRHPNSSLLSSSSSYSLSSSSSSSVSLSSLPSSSSRSVPSPSPPSKSPPPPSKPRRRTRRVCTTCFIAKSKCSEKRPCTRCKRLKKFPCLDRVTKADELEGDEPDDDKDQSKIASRSSQECKLEKKLREQCECCRANGCRVCKTALSKPFVATEHLACFDVPEDATKPFKSQVEPTNFDLHAHYWRLWEVMRGLYTRMSPLLVNHPKRSMQAIAFSLDSCFGGLETVLREKWMGELRDICKIPPDIPSPPRATFENIPSLNFVPDNVDDFPTCIRESIRAGNLPIYQCFTRDDPNTNARVRTYRFSPRLAELLGLSVTDLTHIFTNHTGRHTHPVDASRSMEQILNWSMSMGKAQNSATVYRLLTRDLQMLPVIEVRRYSRYITSNNIPMMTMVWVPL